MVYASLAILLVSVLLSFSQIGTAKTTSNQGLEWAIEPDSSYTYDFTMYNSMERSFPDGEYQVEITITELPTLVEDIFTLGQCGPIIYDTVSYTHLTLPTN